MRCTTLNTDPFFSFLDVLSVVSPHVTHITLHKTLEKCFSRNFIEEGCLRVSESKNSQIISVVFCIRPRIIFEQINSLINSQDLKMVH